MDDYKENNGLEPVPEEENVSGDMPDTQTENTNQPEEIQEEEITAEETEDAGIPITEPEDSGDEENTAPEMCILCEERPADKTYGENYDLCAECRESLIKSPLRFKGFLAVLAILVFSVWGLAFLAPQIDVIEAVGEGYALINEGKKASALDLMSTLTSMGWKTAGRVAEVCYDLGSADDVIYLVESYFYDDTKTEEGEALTWADKVGKSNLNAPWNKELKAKYEYLYEIDELANTHSELFYQYYEQLYYGEITEAQIPYDELIKQYSEDLAAAQSDEEKGIINYYMLALSSICGKDVETQLGYCTAVKDFLPECTWLYSSNLITLSIQAGDYATADEYIRQLKAKNPEDVYADRYTALSLRYQGKYDEAMAILSELIADYNNNGLADAYYDALLCEFLAGNYEEAYKYASSCFNDQLYLTPDSVNFYALLSKQLGKDTGYDAAVEFLKGYDMELSPTVDKYLSGEITTEELIKNGEVVFE